jgi:CRISPR/Cas system-associated exonuclease Cas4 (RecB family)
MNWSHSSLEMHSKCAYQYFRMKVLGDVVSPPAPYFEHGNRVHKAFEDYMLHGTALPADLAQYNGLMRQLKMRPNIVVEASLGMTFELTPTDFNAADVWGRGRIDFMSIDGSFASVVDYKTGKYDPRNGSAYAQAKVNAVLIFVNYPSINHIKGEWAYVEHKATKQFIFDRSRLDALAQPLRDQAIEIEESTQNGTWTPSPSGLCAWCPVLDCVAGASKRKLYAYRAPHINGPGVIWQRKDRVK